MSTENYSLVLENSSTLNNVLVAAMAAGPNTSEWTALEAYFADYPEDLEGLPACREQIINDGIWGGSNLGKLVISILKPVG